MPMWSKLKFFWMWPTMSAIICSESSLEIAVFEILFRKASWRERRCSSAKRPGVFPPHQTSSRPVRTRPRRGLHDVQVAVLEGVLALRVHRSHDPGGPASQQDGRASKALGGPRRHIIDSQSLPRLLQFGADQQRLPAANNELAQTISQFACTLGQNLALLHLQFELDLVAFLESNV